MVRNNHSNENRKKLDALLRSDEAVSRHDFRAKVLDYVRFLANVENVLVVVSDLVVNKSYIIAGGFACNLDIGDYLQEDSIWENRILSLMSPEEQEKKDIAELRYFHFLRHLPKNRKSDYYLVSKLRFRFVDGGIHDVLHKMYYLFDEDKDNIRYALCIYAPLPFDFNGQSYAVNSITGITEELADYDNKTILSPRERQVLSLIDTGMKSAEIADRLNISIHTVSRHRQQIIGKLQVKNSHEACRLAKSMGII